MSDGGRMRCVLYCTHTITYHAPQSPPKQPHKYTSQLDWDDLRGVSAGESSLPQYATANLFKIMTAKEVRR